MLGNLVEALLALCMLSIGPALVAMTIVVVRSLARAHGAQLQPAGGDHAVVPPTRRDRCRLPSS